MKNLHDAVFANRVDFTLRPERVGHKIPQPATGIIEYELRSRPACSRRFNEVFSMNDFRKSLISIATRRQKIIRRHGILSSRLQRLPAHEKRLYPPPCRC